VFREISGVKQTPGEPFRRWFSCESMDLFVWTNDSDEVVSYQLSYDKPHPEKALSWSVERDKYKKYQRPICQYQFAKSNPESILFPVICCNA